MKTPRISFNIRIDDKGSFSGKQIMNAVRKVAGDAYHEVLVEVKDDRMFYEIGHNSPSPESDCVVSADGGNICPQERYSEVITIQSHKHEGEKFAVNVPLETAVKRLRDLSKQVASILLKK
ncbi:MAG: hypothetical protein HYT93_00715 [Parcubacteria group bacterium]|nr:hypothetical protein [Parcubacteria group bacterium]